MPTIECMHERMQPEHDYCPDCGETQTAELRVIRTLRTRAERAEAELAALRADAERYRWLRENYTILLLNGETELRITHGPRANSKSGIDDVIDAARGDTRRGRAWHWGNDDRGTDERNGRSVPALAAAR